MRPDTKPQPVNPLTLIVYTNNTTRHAHVDVATTDLRLCVHSDKHLSHYVNANAPNGTR